MRLAIMLISVVSVLSLSGAPGRAALVPVAADVSVNAANPDSNLNTITTRGGLLSGLDDTGSDYRFFLKFNVGAAVAPEDIGTARLVGTYTDDFGPVDSFHQLFFVPDDSWDESTVTWNTKPALGTAIAGAAFDAIDHSPGDVIEFDVTADVLRETIDDGVLSLALTTIDGRFEDLEFFASREFDPARAFRLVIEADAQPPTGIPLPPAVASGSIALAGALLVATRGARPYAP
jgi:hypothetical protein